jgi:hypothetical protein
MSAPGRDKHPSLLALTSSALLLPAYQQASADAPPDYTQLGMSYSRYQEDDTQSGRTIGGNSIDRYEIDVAQFYLLTPVGDDWSVALDVQWEDMSGASPWFVGLDADGSSKVIMSGASIEDTRTTVSVNTRYYYDRGNAGFTYTRSDEDDYESDAVALDGAFNSADGLTTWSAAISASFDDIEPTQGVTPTNTLEDSKDIYGAFVGVSRIVSKRAIMRFGLSFSYRDGFLTDPYKLADRRPDERKEWALSAGYRHFFTGPNAALHADYRYFDDDWGIASHTLDLSWYQNLGSRSQLIPFLRYYTQDQAEFFSNEVDFTDRYFADDYRLSAFGAVTAGLRVRHRFGNWDLSATGERYSTSEDWGIYSGSESPALVKYWRYSIGFNYSFR